MGSREGPGKRGDSPLVWSSMESRGSRREEGRSVQIALVGDHDPAVVAHQAIPEALRLASRDLAVAGRWTWIHTVALSGDVAAALAGFHGVWCVPASPYADTAGALAAIRFARESRRPFLGTCGGFQHALLEYAAAEWGIEQPAHAELDPAAATPVIAALTCSLIEQQGRVRFADGSRIAESYGAHESTEGYHCRYGLNPAFAPRLAAGSLRATAWDDAGDVRAVELEEHPFFVGTLFQPERAALAGRTPPLVRSFVRAASHILP